MKPFYVYMLKCSDNSYYIGHTDSIEERISAHKMGIGCSYTACRLPIEVVFVHEFGERVEAIKAEHQMKKWSRAKKEALVKGDYNTLQALARGYTGYMKKDDKIS
jgi:predicted GIY-YIG superfamily endonuclease